MAVMAAVPPVDVGDAEVAGDEGGADVAGGADVVFDVLGLLPPHAVAMAASPASASAPTTCEKCRLEFIQLSSN
jgi:hypothetical protein